MESSLLIWWLGLIGGLISLGGCAVFNKPPPRHYCPMPSQLLELPPQVSGSSLLRVFDVHSTSSAVPEGRRIVDWEQQALKIQVSRLVAAVMNAQWQTVRPHLQKNNPAVRYIRWQVTDFGETPRRWAVAYAGFEVVSTLGIAAALVLHKTTRALGWLYLTEESAEEFTEAYAGFWVLNVGSRPVRIQADWVDGSTGAVLAHATATGLSGWTLDAFLDSDAKSRNNRLQQSTRRAVLRLFNALQKNIGAACR